MLINATDGSISILAMDGVYFNPRCNHSYSSAESYITVVKKISSSFNCDVEIFEMSLEPIDGIPTKKITYGKIKNLPDPQEGIFYIVSNVVHAVAESRGRTDVLTPSQPVYDGEEPCGEPYILGYLVLER